MKWLVWERFRYKVFPFIQQMEEGKEYNQRTKNIGCMEGGPKRDESRS